MIQRTIYGCLAPSARRDPNAVERVVRVLYPAHELRCGEPSGRDLRRRPRCDHLHCLVNGVVGILCQVGSLHDNGARPHVRVVEGVVVWDCARHQVAEGAFSPKARFMHSDGAKGRSVVFGEVVFYVGPALEPRSLGPRILAGGPPALGPVQIAVRSDSVVVGLDSCLVAFIVVFVFVFQALLGLQG